MTAPRPQGLAPLRPVFMPESESGTESGGEGYAGGTASSAPPRPSGATRRPPLQFPNPAANAKVLSDRDARTYRSDLIDLIHWCAQHADDAILATTPGVIELPAPPPMPIWGDMDEAECGLIADMLIDQAKRYVVVAQAVRGMVKAWSYVEIGEITIPRAIHTIRWYLRYGFYVHFGLFKLEFGGPRRRGVQP